MQKAKSEIILKIEFLNKKPLELSELTKSLIALSNQYNKHTEQIGYSEEERNAKLYVDEIRTGSVYLDLIEFGSVSVLPFLERTNTIISFATFLKESYNYFLTKKGDKPDLEINDLRELTQILTPIAHDNNSELIINVKNGNSIVNFINYNSADANALQNILKDEIKDKQELKNGDILENALMTFTRTKNEISDKIGNKVIIDDGIEGKEMNLIIPDKKMQRKLIKGEDNPNNFSYTVDVKVKTINGKISAYELIKVHEKFPLNDY